MTVTNGKDEAIDARLEVGCMECTPDFTFFMPYSDSLDNTPEWSLASPQAKLAKHRWWQIFR
jgi:hypothetical protein